jgi:hypothetical protein
MSFDKSLAVRSVTVRGALQHIRTAVLGIFCNETVDRGDDSLKLIGMKILDCLLNLQGLDVGDHIVDMFLASRVVHWIDGLEKGSPYWHILRSVRCEVSSKFEHRGNKSGRVFPLIFLREGCQIRWSGL